MSRIDDAPTDPAPPPRSEIPTVPEGTLRPLGLRCLDLGMVELRAGVAADPQPKPNTGPRVREYLSGCLRDVDRDGDLDRLGLTAGNWCMAFQSWLLEQTIQPGEERPHLYRASCIEAVEDARKLRRWFPIARVRSGEWTPKPGDLCIWDRSERRGGVVVKGTEWFRHVNRVVSYDRGDLATTVDDEFVTLGGNEGRRIVLTSARPKRLDAGNIEGFISYEQRTPAKPLIAIADEPLSALEREVIRGQIAIGLAEILRENARSWGAR